MGDTRPNRVAGEGWLSLRQPVLNLGSALGPIVQLGQCLHVVGSGLSFLQGKSSGLGPAWLLWH